ncbi:MAG: undecaprenyldiphospho-muramoylpentapeptide beta-N-acetylglucosaminyltransferase [Alphaproteobacteria bacterium]
MGGVIVLAAGGTGGHAFPARALAEVLLARGRRVAIVTDRRGERLWGAPGGVDVHVVRAGSPSGPGLVARAQGLGVLALGVFQARGLLKALKPPGVVGFGGYPSVPAVLAAAWQGVPAVVHEQNAVFGRANRFLASRVSAIATSFPKTVGLRPGASGKVRCTGNPVRARVAALAMTPYVAPAPDGPLSLLVLGGSQGAGVMDEVVPDALAALATPLPERLSVAHQCRAEDAESVRRRYEEAAIRAEVAPFFDDVPRRLADAQLVICRAGAATVAEVTAAGRPALFVPYPDATDDHQTRNARAIEDAGGAWIMPQATVTPLALGVRLEWLFAAPGFWGEAAPTARAAARPPAAEALADVVEEVVPANGGRRVRRTGEVALPEAAA